MMRFPLLRMISVIWLSVPGWITATAVSQQDTIPPARIYLNYISVAPQTGATTLNWQKSNDGDVLGYVVYRNQNNVWIALDSIFSANDTVYLDVSSRALFFAESYVVAAFDTSRNVGPLSPPHTTVFSAVTFDSCTAVIIVDWSHYIGWLQLREYRIMLKEGSGSFVPADSIPALEQRLILDSISPGKTYCIYVVAVSPEGYESSSNAVCVTTSMLKPPDYIHALSAKVKDNTSVELTFDSDPAGEIADYLLLSSENPDGPWDPVLQFQSAPGEIIHLTDTRDTVDHPLYYRLTAVNPCGEKVTWSNTAMAMVLTGRNEGFYNHLRWNHYRTFPEGTEKYTIFRQTSGSSWEPAGTVTAADTAFTDDITQLQYTEGNNPRYCYYVEAEGINSGAYPEPLVAVSTSACFYGPVSVHIPNAFTPDGDGINDLFVPVLSFYPQTYRLVIMDRWGRTVFESTNYLEAWDGRDLNGRSVPEGSYTYTLLITTPKGESQVQSGLITVIYRQ